jgi:arylsulfatase A-like enzyme
MTTARAYLAFALLSASVVGIAAAEPASRRPNIIVLLADDLGYGDLRIHGARDIATPHIDSLARGGVRCTSGYVSGPYCSPTRAGLLTGRYQQRFGHEFNPAQLRSGGTGQGLALSETTLPSRLQAAGYATALVGKWHLGEEEAFHPLRRGFDHFFGFLTGSHSYLTSEDAARGPIVRGRESVPLDGYLTDVLAQEAGSFIERSKDRPFFLYLAFNAVHTPLQAPQNALDKFSGETNEQRRTYLAMLSRLDDAVGRVLNKLRELKLEEQTLVFFLSDNGGPTTKFAANGSRNGPLRGSKGDTWEGGIRVPFLVQWKGRLPAGKKYDQPVIQLDIAATALAAAGVEAPSDKKLDGVNLVPHLEGQQESAPHDALYWRFGSQMAIRQGDWKLVRASRGAKEYEDIAREPLLFNLASDIGEQHDLAAQHPDRAKELQAAWDRWNAALVPPSWPATVGGKPALMP